MHETVIMKLCGQFRLYLFSQDGTLLTDIRIDAERFEKLKSQGVKVIE